MLYITDKEVELLQELKLLQENYDNAVSYSYAAYPERMVLSDDERLAFDRYVQWACAQVRALEARIMNGLLGRLHARHVRDRCEYETNSH